MNSSTLTKNLIDLWEAITPEEMKSVEIFSISMEIFIQLLEENSPTSIDLNNTYVNEYLHIEFIKTYNSVLYDTIQELKNNVYFFEENEIFRNQTNGYDLINLDIINNTQKYLTKDDIITFRKMLHSGGLKAGIEYLYKWIGIHSNERLEELKIWEIEPFVLEMEGSITKVIYDSFVKILQHPLGFQYDYWKLIKFDWDNPLDSEYWYNRNNIFQLTSDVIDGNGDYIDSFWKNNHLKEFTSQDFPELQEWNNFNLKFTKADISIQPWFPASEQEKISLLYELDSNMESTGNPLTIVKYDVNVLDQSIETNFTFDNGYSALFLEESIQGGKKTFYYYNEHKDLIFEVGENQQTNVELHPQDLEYTIDIGTCTVLDFLTSQIEQYLEDDTKLTPQEMNVPSDWIIDERPDERKFQFDNRIDFIDYSDLDKSHKPMLFEFLPIGTEIDSNTPYNNLVYAPELGGTLQEDTYKSYEKWNNQYFDWNKPLRNTIEYSKSFQPNTSDQKYYFSALNYEPWQLFKWDEINGKPNYGWWVKPEHEWKFVNQKSNRPIIVGDGHIVNRGVRVVSTIPGFRKELPLPTPYTGSSDIESNRKYWQPKQGIFIPKIGEVPNVIGGMNQHGMLRLGQNYDSDMGSEQDQYAEFLNQRGQGFFQNQYNSDSNFISVAHNTDGYSDLIINTLEDHIGFINKTKITIDNGTLDVSYNDLQKLSDTYFYEEGEDIIAKDESLTNVFWFELPQPRIQKSGSNKHTFYRPISPRQEEYNYMYFEAKDNPLSDPVNMQYMTLEMFEIIQEYTGSEEMIFRKQNGITTQQYEYANQGWYRFEGKDYLIVSNFDELKNIIQQFIDQKQNSISITTHGATKNLNINNIITSKVNNFRGLFENSNFNFNIISWDTSQQKNMERMFKNSELFNQDISHWDVSNVVNMMDMFNGQISFNQDLSQWCVRNIETLPYRFDSNTNWSKNKPQWGLCPRNEDGLNPLQHFPLTENLIDIMGGSSATLTRQTNKYVLDISGIKKFQQNEPQFVKKYLNSFEGLMLEKEFTNNYPSNNNMTTATNRNNQYMSISQQTNKSLHQDINEFIFNRTGGIGSRKAWYFHNTKFEDGYNVFSALMKVNSSQDGIRRFGIGNGTFNYNPNRVSFDFDSQTLEVIEGGLDSNIINLNNKSGKVRHYNEWKWISFFGDNTEGEKINPVGITADDNTTYNREVIVQALQGTDRLYTSFIMTEQSSVKAQGDILQLPLSSKKFIFDFNYVSQYPITKEYEAVNINDEISILVSELSNNTIRLTMEVNNVRKSFTQNVNLATNTLRVQINCTDKTEIKVFNSNTEIAKHIFDIDSILNSNLTFSGWAIMKNILIQE